MAELLKATFYLPVFTRDNLDAEFHISQLVDAILDSIGGCTELGFVRGRWRTPAGRLKIDTHRAFSVLLDRAALPDLVSAIDRFRRAIGETEIYLDVGAVENLSVADPPEQSS